MKRKRALIPVHASPIPLTRHRAGARAFTIIELMAAVAVLSIILLLMSQMTGLVNKAYAEGLGRVDNFTKSRATMDLLASDLRHAVLRPDLPAFQAGGTYSAAAGFSGGNPVNAFYTLLPSINANPAGVARNLSLVSYTVEDASGSDRIALWRADNAANWADNTVQKFQDDMSAPLAAAQKREMAPGVVALQLLFRQQDGTVRTTYPGYHADNPVTSVGVALAVIGDTALQHLTSGQIQAIQSALAIPPDITLPSAKAYWDGTKLTTSFFGSYPKDLGSNLRTFERWINCPAF